MATNYTDQFYYIDPGNPPVAGTVLNVSLETLRDKNDNGLIDDDDGDRVAGKKVLGVYNGDTITVENPDGSIQTITGTTFYLRGGTSVFTPTDDSVLEDGAVFLSSSWVPTSTELDVTDLGPACFARGTFIETADGPRLVETLQEGELILTYDGTFKPLLWRCDRTVDGRGDHAPIRICAGAFGNKRDLIVSPQHRILIDSWRAELYFGSDEVLVAAKHLVGTHDMVHVMPVDSVDYFHLLLDGHHLIWSEGALTESIDPGGDFAREDPMVRRQAHARFPHLFSEQARPETVRRIVKGREANVMFA